MGLFLYENRLLIIATDDLQPDESPQTLPVRTPQDAMLAIMHQSVHHYMEHLRVIKTIARELQEKINQSMENRHLIQMFNLSESLVYYLNAVDSNSAVLTRLHGHAKEVGFNTEVIAFIDDLAIESNQCYKQAEIYSTILSGLMDARGNIVNNNMNVLLKNLTVINVVFLPLNLIAGIGGMSEFSKITQHTDWRIAYGLLFVAMVILGWLTALLLKRVKSGAKATVTARR
jgi:magnesium transporter